MKHPELTTERLVLRKLKDTDDTAIFSFRSNDEVLKYIGRPKQTAIEEAQAFIQKIKTNVAKGQSYYWGIALKDKPELIGTICLWNLSDDRKTAELGYELHPDFQGNGYMQEAIQAVSDFAFQKAGFSLLEAFTHHDNQASAKLLRKKGFVLNPERKDPDYEHNIIFELNRS
ncbi:MAG TPA: GNAT family N-acetyltransferase [Chitinophagaceae bacterium]|nr:GNAT family N-acetyltransferase [Chitinophagaceae bacterium]